MSERRYTANFLESSTKDEKKPIVESNFRFLASVNAITPNHSGEFYGIATNFGVVVYSCSNSRLEPVKAYPHNVLHVSSPEVADSRDSPLQHQPESDPVQKQSERRRDIHLESDRLARSISELRKLGLAQRADQQRSCDGKANSRRHSVLSFGVQIRPEDQRLPAWRHSRPVCHCDVSLPDKADQIRARGRLAEPRQSRQQNRHLQHNRRRKAHSHDHLVGRQQRANWASDRRFLFRKERQVVPLPGGLVHDMVLPVERVRETETARKGPLANRFDGPVQFRSNSAHLLHLGQTVSSVLQKRRHATHRLQHNGHAVPGLEEVPPVRTAAVGRCRRFE